MPLTFPLVIREDVPFPSLDVEELKNIKKFIKHTELQMFFT